MKLPFSQAAHHRAGSRFLFAGLLLALGLSLSSCSTVKVRTKEGKLIRGLFESAEDLKVLDESAAAEAGEDCLELIREARKFEMLGQKEQAAACYLHTAVHSREHLLEDASRLDQKARSELIDMYNYSLARFSEYWLTSHGKNPAHQPVYSCGHATYQVSTAADSYFAEDYFDKVIATVALVGKGVVEKERDGIGASLLGIRDKTPERSEELKFFSSKGVLVPVSAVVTGLQEGANGKHNVTISLYNPLLKSTFDEGGRTYPLAADFSAPYEKIFTDRNQIIAGVKGFLFAGKRLQISGIYLTEPYDPNRIPVILTHGLASSPFIWRNVVAELQAEEDISQRYQFLVFAYPSSLTIPESSKLLRDCLEDLRDHYDPERDDPLSRNMVAAGHSMGGILTHMLIAEMGDRLWRQVSDQPLDQLGLPPEVEKEMHDLSFFEADPAIRRAIFLSTPHKGSAAASEIKLANLASRLANLPSTTLQLPATIIESATIELDHSNRPRVGRKMTSIQSLRPDSPTIMALKDAPFKQGVIYHSIMGDQGMGNTPDSSDGLVEYKSSHLPGAASELIVPTGHSSYTHPEAVAELKRILRLHAGL